MGKRISAAGLLSLLFIFLLLFLSSVAQADTTNFSGKELLGKPTDTSIAINIVPDSSIAYYYEYGTAPGVYTNQTPPVTATGGVPHESVITGLSPNTKYYYRMVYDADGSVDDGDDETRDEHTFYTQRAAGESFVFTVTSDSHGSFGANTPVNILNGNPDFNVDLGDTFMVDNGLAETQTAFDGRYLQWRGASYFGGISHSVPVYLAPGNHEEEEGWNFDDTPSRALLNIEARKRYFPMPNDGAFYSASTETHEDIDGDQLRQDYYAWEWGDALFVVIDPFQHTMTMPYSPIAGEENDETIVADQWNWTLGIDQYIWLKNTLESSRAKYKFVFSHNMVGGVTTSNVSGGPGYVRGGAEAAGYFEWGGYNSSGTYEWNTRRPASEGWDVPIQQLFTENGVSAYFHGHDHQYVYETRDGVVYQEVPSPSMGASGFSGIYFEGDHSDYYGDYSTIEILPNAGHLKITVTPTVATVDYIASSGGTNYSYTIEPNETSPAVPLYRINNGGPDIDMSASGEPDFLGLLEGDASAISGLTTSGDFQSDPSTSDAIDMSGVDPNLPEALFQTANRTSPGSGSLNFTFEVPNGEYQVILHWSEQNASYTSIGDRVFDVFVEGVEVLPNYDMAVATAEAGANVAITEVVPTTVIDDELTVTITADVSVAIIRGIEIVPVNTGPDTTPPVITLSGDAEMTVYQGSAFTDPGATASDNVDGDITGDIVVGGDIVDTGILGDYVITYDVQDAAGNDADQVTRTVHVVAAPPIFLDGDASSGTADGVSSISFAHTTGTGAARLLLVGVSANSYNGAQTISSVTFTPDGGSAIGLDLIESIENEAGRLAAIYGLVNPPSGQAGQVAVTFSGTVNYGIIAGAVNFAGVDQADPVGEAATATGQSTTQSVQLTGLDGDEFVFDTAFIGAATIPSVTVGTGQTEQWNATIDRAGGVASIAQATGDTVEMSWSTGDTSVYWAIAAVPVNPAATGPDEIPPVITLSGDAEMTVYQGSAFTDPGATASDNVDGDITGDIVVGGDTVDTGILGDYVINYDVQDAAGNDAARVTRIVHVVAAPPIYIDGDASSTTANEVQTVSFAHTTGTGDNRLMLVGVTWNCGTNNRTINEVAFTPSEGGAIKLDHVFTQPAANSSGDPRYSAIYSLVAPPEGFSGIVTVSFNEGNVSNGIVAGAVNFAGVDPVNPLGIPDGAQATSSSAATLTLAGLNGDELIFDTVFQGASDESQTLTAGAGQTEQWNGFAGNTRGAASIEEATGSSVTMSWTASSASVYAIAAVPVKPVGSVPNMPEYNILLGRPTADSITINAIVEATGEVYFECGTESGIYTSGQTGILAIGSAGEPVEGVINGLNADTQYFYRMVYTPENSSTSIASEEYTFHTQRASGETFSFTVISDSHLGDTFSGNDPERYLQTTLNVAADHPDFHIDLGDAFNTSSATTQAATNDVYLSQRPYFGNFSHSAPVFLAIGNHENEEGWNLDDSPFSKALASIIARKQYFLNPVTDGFYSGNDDPLPEIGGDQLREDYYAWEWGDALFIVLDPFQYTMTKPYPGSPASEDDDEIVDEDQWVWTLGKQQFQWLKQTLENSDAKFKFVFSHHVTGGIPGLSVAGAGPGYVRGGAEAAAYFEWGGLNADGTPGFANERNEAEWGPDPIHELMRKNGVTIFFHGHDHQFVHEVRDGVVYQLVPSASMASGDFGFDLYDGNDYVQKGGNLPNAGHLRVTVEGDLASVEYVRSAISVDTDVSNAEVSYAYDVEESSSENYTLEIATAGSGSVTLDPPGGTYAPGTEVELTATPEQGWQFSNWSGDLTGSANPASIIMDGNKTVTATFTQINPVEFTLTVNTSGSGSVSRDISGPYTSGTEVELTATPEQGWQFSNWSGDLTGSANPASIIMDGNKTVTATFTQINPVEFTLTVNTSGSGSVSRDVPGPYLSGTEVELTATPEQGWQFSNWSGDLTGSANPASITMDGNKTVTANFTEISSNCVLDSRFVETSLFEGMEYYTDRDYILTDVPFQYGGLDAIITPNEEREFTDESEYLTFTMPFDGTLYVAFDSRAISLPSWMDGFVDTGDRLLTSLSSQPALRIYGKDYNAGECINFGANKAPGFTGSTVSNYVVFYGQAGIAPCPPLAARFETAILTQGLIYYTDRAYTLTSVPGDYTGMDAIITPNDDRDLTTASEYLTFRMPYDGMLYVAFDSRATSLPSWMDGFVDTGDSLLTSLSTQPALKIYVRIDPVSAGDCINLGANKAPGFTGSTVSNYLVFYEEVSISPTYTLSLGASPIEGGTTFPAVGDHDYTENSVVDISATAAPGYVFVNWSGNVNNPTSANTTVTMNQAQTVTANFTALPTFVLSIGASPTAGGTTVPAAGNHDYVENSVVNISATPAQGYAFDSWSGPVADPDSANTTVTMDQAHTVTANFTALPTFVLSIGASPAAGGTTVPAAGNHDYVENSVVNISATPAQGYAFDSWSGPVASPESANTTVTMDQAHNVTANFIITPCAPLDARFVETSLFEGMEYYTDRDYTLTSVPYQYEGMDAILTPNEEREYIDTSNYVTFTMPYDGTVYVAFDSRATSLPNWMNGFVDTGDRLLTSLSSQPALKIYGKNFNAGDCINLGANKAPGFIGSTVSNYIVFMAGDEPLPCRPLDARFEQAILTEGITYYTDRDYTLTSVPAAYTGMNAILTPNDEREYTMSSGYVTFTMPVDGTLYVAFDSRAASLPDWMDGFIDTGDRLLTSLSTQPALKIYSRPFFEGDCINLGANKAIGFSGTTVSNYVVFLGGNVPIPCATLDARFKRATLTEGMAYYTDRDYTLTGVPAAYAGMNAILTPNDEREFTDASNYVTFAMPYDGMLYVAFDSRATSLPDWMDGFIDTGDRLLTSLSTQPGLKIYGKDFNAGDCINFGANKAPGFAGATVSNYMVIY